MKNRIFNIRVALFVDYMVLAAIHLYAVSKGYVTLAHWTKPFLMPMLGLYCLSVIFQRQGNRYLALLLSIALLFHTAGDILLMFGSDVLFLVGMGCFMAGNFLYLFAILKGGAVERLPVWTGVIYAVSVCVAAWLVMSRFADKVGILHFVYAAILLSVPMAGFVGIFNPFSEMPKKGSAAIAGGGLCFVLSDYMIAMGKFGGLSLPDGGLWIMIFYIVAQSLICKGITMAAVPHEDEV